MIARLILLGTVLCGCTKTEYTQDKRVTIGHRISQEPDGCHER